MKKWIIILGLIMLCCMSACGSGNVNDELETTNNDCLINEISDKSDSDENANGEELEMDANNRTIIAEALGVEEKNRNIRFILSSLDTIGAGQVQSAVVAEDDGKKVINLVAEDGTDYRIYLSGNGSVEAVKNLATGEWPIRSER